MRVGVCDFGRGARGNRPWPERVSSRSTYASLVSGGDGELGVRDGTYERRAIQVARRLDSFAGRGGVLVVDRSDGEAGAGERSREV